MREFLYVHAILRQPHHLIPSSWPGAQYYRFFLLAALAAMALAWEPGALRNAWRNPAHRRVVTWCAVILAMGVAGYVFVEVVPIKLIIKLQLFRMTIFVKFFLVLYTALLLFRVIEKDPWPRKACALAILAIQNFAVIGACAALLFALRQRQAWLWGVALFVAGWVTGVAMVATASLGTPIPMFFHSFAVASRGIWVGVASLVLLAALTWRYARLVPISLLGLAVALRLYTGVPFFGFDGPPADPWVKFCRQIGAGTPRDAVFLNPPHLGGFQMFAERAEIADFKNSPSTERDLLEWERRMDDLNGAPLRCSGWVECSSSLAGGYSRLREHELLALAHKYGAQYVITADARQKLHFPEVFRLDEFTLYKVPQ